MLFYKEYNFTTPLNKEEIRKILKAMKNSSDKRIWKFDGVVESDEFTLRPYFYQNHQYAFRPEVHGVITSDKKESKIFLKLRIPSSLKFLMYLMCAVNGIIWIYFLFLKIHTEFLILLPLAALIFFVLIKIEFNQRGNRAIEIIIDKLKLKNI